MGDAAQDGPAPDSSEKKMVAGFEVLGELGRGAMGAVFKARQVSVDRLVALKILPPHLAKNKTFIERFLREAHAAAHLNHPNIVQAIDAGHAGLYYYFAMEFVDGQSADELLESGGALPERRALEIVRDVARALEHAHEANLIHRDIKPDNILISSSGTAKLADLGLARETTNLDNRLTQTGVALGTPDYISPEQARGSDKIDGRTDIYSLGATLFHLLTGSVPYPAGSVIDTIYKHMHSPVPDPRKVNPAVSVAAAAIVHKAMAKDPRQRYANATAMLVDLERVIQMRATTAVGKPGAAAPHAPSLVTQRTVETPIPGPRAGVRRARSKTWPIAAGAVAAAALLAILAIVFLPARGPKPDSDVAGPGTTEQTPGQADAAASAYDQRILDHAASYVADLLKKKPDDYRGGIQKWTDALKELKTPLGRMQANDAIRDIEAARADAADGALATLAESADMLAQAGDYDAAAAVYAKLPDEFSDLLADRAKQSVGEIKSAAEAKINAAMAEARKLAAVGQPEAGIGELDKLKGVKYAALDGELAKLRQELDAQTKNEAENQRRRELDAARKAVEKLIADIEAAVSRGDLAEAARLGLAAEEDGNLKPVDDQRQRVVAVAKALAAADAVQKVNPVETLKQQIGKKDEITLATARGTFKGTVKSVGPDKDGADMVVLERDLGYKVGGQEQFRTYNVKIADLTPETVAGLRPKWAADAKNADEQIAAAILAAAAKDVAALDAALKAAAGHPLHARYTERLAALKMGELEYAATKAWGEGIAPLAAKPNLTASEGAALLKLLDSFAEKYGSTAFAAGRTAEVASLRAAPAEAAAKADWEKLTRAASRTTLTEPQAEAAMKALDDFTATHATTAFAASVKGDIPALRQKLFLLMPKIRFDSKLPLSVYVVEGFDEWGEPIRKPLGETPSKDGQGVAVPKGCLWVVRHKKTGGMTEQDVSELAALAREVKKNAIPGLDLDRPYASKSGWVNDQSLANLKDLDQIEYLSLHFVQTITDAGMVWLKDLRRLKYLDLEREHGGKIGDTSIELLAGLGELTSLNLQCCNVTDKGAETLAKFKKLEHLNVSYTKLGDAGLEKLADLPELKSLELPYTYIKDGGLVHVARMRNLKSLALPWPITDAGFANLSEMTWLEHLDCMWYKDNALMTDASLGHIGRLTALQQLRLYGWEKITDAGFARLAGLKNLQDLSLAGCKQVTDAALRHLEVLTALETLDIKGTAITEQARAALIAKIDANRKRAGASETAAKDAWLKIKDYAAAAPLTEARAAAIAKALDTFDEKYGETAFAATVKDDIAALRQKIAPKLPMIRFESKLNLGVYLIEETDWHAPWPQYKSIGSTPTKDGSGVLVPVGSIFVVNPGAGANLTDGDWKALATEIRSQSVPGLGVSLEKATNADAVLAHFRGLTCLKLLHVDLGAMTDAGAANVATLTGLRYLQVRQGAMTDAGFEHIKQLKELEQLVLNVFGAKPPINGSGLRHLSELPKLRRFSLHYATITDDALAEFKAPALEYLSLSSSGGYKGQGLSCLRGMPNLRHLDLSRSAGFDAALEQLDGLDKLEFFAIGNDYTAPARGITDAGVAHIAKLKALKELRMIACPNVSSAAIAELATQLVNLERLNLTDCQGVTEAPLAQIGKLKGLKELRLTRCTQVTGDGLAGLRGLPQLEILMLDGCGKVTDAGLAHLAAVPSLKGLRLDACVQITDNGLAALRGLRQLEALGLSGCVKVTSAGLKHLAAIPSLTGLDLTGCTQITNDGLAALKALRQLTNLELDQCDKITDAGVKHLQVIPSLRNVYVGKGVTDRGIAALKAAIPMVEVRR